MHDIKPFDNIRIDRNSIWAKWWIPSPWYMHPNMNIRTSAHKKSKWISSSRRESNGLLSEREKKRHLRRYNSGKNQNKFSRELESNADRVLELYYFFVCLYVSQSISLPFSLLVCLSCMSVCLSPCPSLFMCICPPLPHKISVSLSLYVPLTD